MTVNSAGGVRTWAQGTLTVCSDCYHCVASARQSLPTSECLLPRPQHTELPKHPNRQRHCQRPTQCSSQMEMQITQASLPTTHPPRPLCPPWFKNDECIGTVRPPTLHHNPVRTRAPHLFVPCNPTSLVPSDRPVSLDRHVAVTSPNCCLMSPSSAASSEIDLEHAAHLRRFGLLAPLRKPCYAAIAVALTACSTATNASTCALLNSPSGPRGVRSVNGDS